MSHGPVLSVTTGACASEEGLARVRANLAKALAESDQELLTEVEFEVVPACEAPAVVISNHGVGGGALPYLAEHPEGFLVYAFAETPPTGEPCPCCEKPA